MNNAGIGPGTGVLGPADAWARTLEVNLWGVIRGTQAFVPRMIARGRPGLVDQHRLEAGHHHAAGQPGLQRLEGRGEGLHRGLAHELRNTEGARISAHLLIPGFVFTGLTKGDRREKPPAAWTPEETVDFMLERLEAGDFYILCPDNDVPRALDERRIVWSAGDIIENRPALSRWHPDFAEAFAAFVRRD